MTQYMPLSVQLIALTGALVCLVSLLLIWWHER